MTKKSKMDGEGMMKRLDELWDLGFIGEEEYNERKALIQGKSEAVKEERSKVHCN